MEAFKDELIKNKINDTLNVFEGGTVEPNYACITVYNDGENGSFQLTFGKNQTTEQGNLIDLFKIYIERKGKYSEELKDSVNKMSKNIPLLTLTQYRKYSSAKNKQSIIETIPLLKILQLTGTDPIMHQAQDDFFEEKYFSRAFKWFNENKFITNLALLVIFDSFVHSGQIRDDIRNMFPEVPPVKGGDEKKWITQYVNSREKWLLSRANPILRKTIYRTQCFKRLIKENNWDLIKPYIAKDTIIIT